MDASNFKANPISGFVFNTAPADNPGVTAALTAYRTLQEDYYKNFMIGGYGDDTAAKLEEFYGLAKDNAEIIREELVKQLQAFLDSKQQRCCNCLNVIPTLLLLIYRNMVRQGGCFTSESEVRQPLCTPYRFIAYRED